MAAVGIILTALTANATPYAARVRWQPSPDGDIAGYRLYLRTGSGALQPVLDAGLPPLATDGTLAASVSGLAPCVTYGFAVTAYRADRTESAPSNEVSLTSLDCSDGNACTTDSCDPAAGCVHVAVAGCAACTSAANCNDGNRCTTDACVAGRCTHTALADGAACDDGLFCDGAEVCRAGVCTAGAPVRCDDGSPCTVDACDEGRHACTHSAIAGCCTVDADCAVTDLCQTNPRCTANACTTDPLICPDPGQCATASCDPTRGCVTTPVADGTPCDDGDLCTVNDVCTAGTCGAGAAALAVASGSEGGATRLSTRTTATGFTLSARSWFPIPDGFDVATSDVQLALRDDTGAVRFATTVPGGAFLVSRGRAVYADDHRLEGSGFTRIELRTRSGRVAMAVRAAVVAAGVAAPGIDEPRAATDTYSTIEWAVRMASKCVNGSGQCRWHGRRCW